MYQCLFYDLSYPVANQLCCFCLCYFVLWFVANKFDLIWFDLLCAKSGRFSCEGFISGPWNMCVCLHESLQQYKTLYVCVWVCVGVHGCVWVFRGDRRSERSDVSSKRRSSHGQWNDVGCWRRISRLLTTSHYHCVLHRCLRADLFWISYIHGRRSRGDTGDKSPQNLE